MPPIKVQVSERTEKRFREVAMKRFGYGKGSLSLAAERAFTRWIAREEPMDDLLSDIDDPIDAIEGVLAHVKKGSVALQHEATRIRARRALIHASHRR
jgi:hypothetical protein